MTKSFPSKINNIMSLIFKSSSKGNNKFVDTGASTQDRSGNNRIFYKNFTKLSTLLFYFSDLSQILLN